MYRRSVHTPGIGWDTKFVSQLYPQWITFQLHRGTYLLTATTGSPTQVGENSWGLCFIDFQGMGFSITIGFCWGYWLKVLSFFVSKDVMYRCMTVCVYRLLNNSFRTWKKVSYLFWVFLVFYSSLVKMLRLELPWSSIFRRTSKILRYTHPLKTNVLNPKMEVWFRWVSFSKGWFSGSSW